MNASPNGFIRRLETLSQLFERVARRLSIGFMAIMAVCILIQIVARYLIAEPPAWTEELARHAMIWGGFLGATVACRRRLDPVLVNHATFNRNRLRHIARWLEAAAILIFGTAILVATPRFLALHSERFTESLQIPSVLVVVIIPLCILIIMFQAIVRVLVENSREMPAEK
ncbi:MAG: TRAP transporter small permease subunit [Xanthomonadales bacterium]|jgi:TRAP-type C4-dicarboxylate transport system permease small subunit|nr:TRAP transporter small permease subunit [Xanthomonadales bacterium]